MLWNASNIQGYAISASDGEIGTISDFLFDDASWLVRWLVVDTGNWLSGRKVLLPSSAMAHLDSQQKNCSIKLTKQQIKDSPSVNTERPVSRQMESSVYDHYGYSPLWNNGYSYMGGLAYLGGFGYLGGLGGAQLNEPRSESEDEIVEMQRNSDDVHLRSFDAVNGYHIHASDGAIGHIADFLIADIDWSMRYLVVDTKNWWPGKKVLISARSVKEIDWNEHQVNVDVKRQKIKGGPTYDPSVPIDQAYEKKYLAYYNIELAAA